MTPDALFETAGRDWLLEEYQNKERSTYSIAKELGTYPNLVGRALKHHKIELRSKSDAQRAALKNGRRTHPTRGTQRSSETRLRISDAMARAWQKMSKPERTRRVQLGKDHWASLSADEKKRMRGLAMAGARRATQDGSRLEQYLEADLRAAGHDVEVRRPLACGVTVDLYVPARNTVIKVDGPSHFLPIWGEEALTRAVAADDTALGALVADGHQVIRIRSLARNLSDFQMRAALSALEDAIAHEPTNIVIELEVQ